METYTKHDYYKGAERLLYSYKYLKGYLKSKQEELKAIEYCNIASIDFDRINTCRTNDISQPTEMSALDNIEKADRLKREIKKVEVKINAIEEAIQLFNETEKKIIRLRYYDKEYWDKIGLECNMSKRQAQRLNQDIINNLKVTFFGLNVIKGDCQLLREKW